MRGIGQSSQAVQAPAASAVVDRPGRHSQGTGDAVGALPLGTPQHDSSAQGLAPAAIAHCSLELTPLGWSQFDAVEVAALSLLLLPTSEGGSHATP